MSIRSTWVLIAAFTVVAGCGGTGKGSAVDGSRADTAGPSPGDGGTPSDAATLSDSPALPDNRGPSDTSTVTDLLAQPDDRGSRDTSTVDDMAVQTDSSADQNTGRDVNENDGPNSLTDLAKPDDAAIADRPHDQAPTPDLKTSDLPVLDSAADLAVDAGGSDLDIVPDAAGAAELCTSTLGTVTATLCCAGVTDFPNMCISGACGCAPASSHTINRCNCGSACFMPGLGCVGAASVCTVGANQTCNDNPVISSVHGRCVEGGRCVCLTGSGLNASTGKCL